MRNFTEEEMIEVLLNWEMSLNPDLFESTSDLDSMDFMDAAVGQAEALGLKEKFDAELTKHGYKG